MPITQQTKRKTVGKGKRSVEKASRELKSDPSVLELPALQITQGANRKLYLFAADGKLLESFATISRLGRAETGKVSGYQRPEVVSHISEIRRYIESDSPMVPNALVVAFDSRVKFRPADKKRNGEYSRPGTLSIPLNADQKPGWIVDGQQRSAAIRDADVSSFPVAITAFVADDLAEQREQFILVNSTKPLPKSLVFELLPDTNAQLPRKLNQRKFPAEIMTRLNFQEDSPFAGRIKMHTNPDGTIQDTSVLRMIENSLSDGVLYGYRDRDSDRGDIDAIAAVLSQYWSTVAKVFDDAWCLPPRRSRLTHGAGIISMGFLMDAIYDRFCASGNLSSAEVEAELQKVAPSCRWTNGFWELGPGVSRRWNELQNTPSDIQLLTNYIMACYLQTR